MRIRITVKKIPEDELDPPDDGELTLEFSGEKDIYEYKEIFRIILRFISFSDDVIDEIFKKKEEDE